MRIAETCGVIILVAVMTGCAASRTDVVVGQLSPKKRITTAALVPHDGNSPEMDSHIQQHLLAKGVATKQPLSAGTRQSEDVDVMVAYSDAWRWDIVMYLRSITISFFDGPSGNLLVTGRWDNSTPHGFQKPRDVVKRLLDDIFAKLPAPK